MSNERPSQYFPPETVLRTPEGLNPELLLHYVPLVDQRIIDQRIRDLYIEQIKPHYGDGEFTFVPIMDGAAVVGNHLLGHINSQRSQARYDSVRVSTRVGIESSKIPRIHKLPNPENINGKSVLIVEDLLDTGLTLAHVQRRLQEAFTPTEVRTFVLLAKSPELRTHHPQVDFMAFDEEFSEGTEFRSWLIGYTFDVNGKFRRLKHIWVKIDTINPDFYAHLAKGKLADGIIDVSTQRIRHFRDTDEVDYEQMLEILDAMKVAA